MVRSGRSVLVFCGVLTPWGFNGEARADPGVDTKVAKADQLFAEGKALLSSNLLQACDKFEESLGFNPAAIGTLLNVALCDEKLGRSASAVAKFSEARARAVEQGLSQHVRAAEEHIATLTPIVPHLTVKLTEVASETRVLVDDRVVALDSLSEIAVDPGERVVVVSAPKRLPYRTKVKIEKAEHRDVVIPLLDASVIVRSSQRRIGQVATAVGGAVILAGTGVGLYARHLYRSQFGHQRPGDGLCDEMNTCEPAGKAATERAVTIGNVGTVIGVVGVGLACTGLYLWFRSPSTTADLPDHKLTLAPTIAPDSLGVIVEGRF